MSLMMLVKIKVMSSYVRAWLKMKDAECLFHVLKELDLILLLGMIGLYIFVLSHSYF